MGSSVGWRRLLPRYPKPGKRSQIQNYEYHEQEMDATFRIYGCGAGHRRRGGGGADHLLAGLGVSRNQIVINPPGPFNHGPPRSRRTSSANALACSSAAHSASRRTAPNPSVRAFSNAATRSVSSVTCRRCRAVADRPPGPGGFPGRRPGAGSTGPSPRPATGCGS